jgi:hypothetical protein
VEEKEGQALRQVPGGQDGLNRGERGRACQDPLRAMVAPGNERWTTGKKPREEETVKGWREWRELRAKGDGEKWKWRWMLMMG